MRLSVTMRQVADYSKNPDGIQGVGADGSCLPRGATVLTTVCTPEVRNRMTQRLIHVGHSPDPDDAFMFYALAHDKIDTGDLRFVHQLQDIETLNRRALRGELEVTAISLHAYAHLLDKYALLPSGCSMGDRYRPMF